MSIRLVGLFFITFLAGSVVTATTGNVSDSLQTRKWIFRFALAASALGWLLFAASRNYMQAIAISVVFLSFQGTVYAQLLAILRDSMRQSGEKQEGAVGSAIRTPLSAGYAIGPLIGATAGAVFGYRWTFGLTAALWLALLPLTAGFTMAMPPKVRKALATGKHRLPIAVVTFALAAMVALSGDTVKVAYLPILVVERMHQSPVVIGSLLSLGTAAEVVTMPLAGRFADRFGFQRTIVAALLIGLADYAFLAQSSNLWQLYVVQLAHAGTLGTLHGIGALYIQALSPGSVGTATSLLVSIQSLASPLGATVGSYGAALFGVPAIFFIPSLFCGGAALLTALTGHAQHFNTRVET